jgi:hypothetical protein
MRLKKMALFFIKISKTCYSKGAKPRSLIAYRRILWT